jgi:hypothetical protein
MRPQRDLEPSRKHTRALLHILGGSDRCDEFGVPAIVQGGYIRTRLSHCGIKMAAKITKLTISHNFTVSSSTLITHNPLSSLFFPEYQNAGQDLHGSSDRSLLSGSPSNFSESRIPHRPAFGSRIVSSYSQLQLHQNPQLHGNNYLQHGGPSNQQPPSFY